MPDEEEELYLRNISKNETYSSDEKQFIMDRLNEERLKHRQIEEGFELKITSSNYSKSDKERILQQINEDRLKKQKKSEITISRTKNKQIYKIGAFRYYKLLNMKREFFLKVEDIDKISEYATLISLEFQTLDALQTKDVLIKVESYSEKFFISYDPVRIYFKGYILEDRR